MTVTDDLLGTAVDVCARIKDSTHRYGPHSPADAPTTVDVYPHGKWTKLTTVPIAASVVRQRKRINDIAARPPGAVAKCVDSLREVIPPTETGPSQ